MDRRARRRCFHGSGGIEEMNPEHELVDAHFRNVNARRGKRDANERPRHAGRNRQIDVAGLSRAGSTRYRAAQQVENDVDGFLNRSHAA